MFNQLPKNIRNISGVKDRKIQEGTGQILAGLPDQPGVPPIQHSANTQSNSITVQLEYQRKVKGGSTAVALPHNPTREQRSLEAEALQGKFQRGSNAPLRQKRFKISVIVVTTHQDFVVTDSIEKQSGSTHSDFSVKPTQTHLSNVSLAASIIHAGLNPNLIEPDPPSGGRPGTTRGARTPGLLVPGPTHPPLFPTKPATTKCCHGQHRLIQNGNTRAPHYSWRYNEDCWQNRSIRPQVSYNTPPNTAKKRFKAGNNRKEVEPDTPRPDTPAPRAAPRRPPHDRSSPPSVTRREALMPHPKDIVSPSVPSPQCCLPVPWFSVQLSCCLRGLSCYCITESHGIATVSHGHRTSSGIYRDDALAYRHYLIAPRCITVKYVELRHCTVLLRWC
ncbi:hypothetical protein GWK47_022678 [Chionoecetes opilio]|uniref:Uncharacterized protein n=1 Tax=Chionoecetes opilio TaxID=41210 RepID=A0A8J5CH17_CHIOP|nr:hypothetical protein GWK47_022678 [Chionoecetes opilio]